MDADFTARSYEDDEEKSSRRAREDGRITGWTSASASSAVLAVPATTPTAVPAPVLAPVLALALVPTPALTSVLVPAAPAPAPAPAPIPALALVPTPSLVSVPVPAAPAPAPVPAAPAPAPALVPVLAPMPASAVSSTSVDDPSKRRGWFVVNNVALRKAAFKNKIKKMVWDKERYRIYSSVDDDVPGDLTVRDIVQVLAGVKRDEVAETAASRRFWRLVRELTPKGYAKRLFASADKTSIFGCNSEKDCTLSFNEERTVAAEDMGPHLLGRNLLKQSHLLWTMASRRRRQLEPGEAIKASARDLVTNNGTAHNELEGGDSETKPRCIAFGGSGEDDAVELSIVACWGELGVVSCQHGERILRNASGGQHNGSSRLPTRDKIPAIQRSLFAVLLSTAISRSIGFIRRSWLAYGDAIREPERVLCFNRTGTGLRRLAGDITVTACPDVGAEAGRMHVAFLLNVWGAFTAGYLFNYISQTLHFNFVDSSRGNASILSAEPDVDSEPLKLLVA
ncbi:hypothetical protein C8R44DRAFT_746846 [Mycena epipterygia]|nr:hypothetical protein C8R44DRAFT_746846 [Mycena epipterygia]